MSIIDHIEINAFGNMRWDCFCDLRSGLVEYTFPPNIMPLNAPSPSDLIASNNIDERKIAEMALRQASLPGFTFKLSSQELLDSIHSLLSEESLSLFATLSGKEVPNDGNPFCCRDCHWLELRFAEESSDAISSFIAINIREDMPHEQIICILENARKRRLTEAGLYRFYSREFLDSHTEA